MIYITRQKFLAALSIATKATPAHSTMKILHNVALRHCDKELHIASTNFRSTVDLTITEIRDTAIALESTQVSTAFTNIAVPARFTLDIVKAIPNEVLELNSNGEQLVIVYGATRARATIKGTDIAEFPVPKKQEPKIKFSMPTEKLLTALKHIIITTAGNDGTEVLQGISITVQHNQLNLLSCDRYRLSRHTCDIEYEQEEEQTAVISGDSLRVLLDVLKYTEVATITVTLSDNDIKFVCGDNVVALQLVDGKYPDIDHIVPAHSAIHITGPSTELISAIQINELFNPDEICVELVDAENQHEWIISASSQVGDCTSRVPATADSNMAKVYLNPAYMRSVLEGSTAQGEIGFNAPTDPIRIDLYPGLVRAVMPMRIHNK